MSYLALDLGAGSGRAIVGTLVNNKMHLHEIHRFSNAPVKLGGTLYWNFLSLFSHIKEGIYKAVQQGYELKGIAVDTWGVDFGLIDSKGNLLSNPVCYRDQRTIGISESLFQHVSKEYLYEATGIQLMEINTLFQLYSLIQSNDASYSIADKLLFTPDLINFYLTGKATNEYTIASTSQLLDAKSKEWDHYIFQQIEVKPDLFCNIVKPGDEIGNLSTQIVSETGATEAKVFAVGSHDTASAIAAIPASGDHWAFLSSGTWSLLGILGEETILTEEACSNDFTNEGGVDDKILFMRNITGLWLLQRLIAEWEKEDNKKLSYEFLLSGAADALPFSSIVNSDDPLFTNPVSMSKAIQEYCLQTDQSVPQGKGGLVRCVLESLAIKYCFVMQKLQECSGREIQQLHIVGGGSQNELLNQFIANALNMEVIVGLTEATAVGNIVQQAIANKEVASWIEGHQLILNSFDFKSFKPVDTQVWQEKIKQVQHLFLD